MLWSGMRSLHTVPDSHLSQGNMLFASSCQVVDRMSWKRKRSWTADASCRFGADCTLMGDSEQQTATDPAKMPFLPGDFLRGLSVRRPLSQPAAPSGKSSVQDGLASSARNCRCRMRDPTDSRNRRQSPVQRANIPAQGSVPRRAGLRALKPVSEFCCEFDFDVVSFQPRLLLQELILAHCPYQPRRPMIGLPQWRSIEG